MSLHAAIRMSLKEPGQNFPKRTKIERLRMNYNRMSLEGPEQNLGTSLPHPIHQYTLGNINTQHIHMRTYAEFSIESHSQKFYKIT